MADLSAEEAVARLAKSGFESERRSRESSEEDFGKVLERSVTGGEKAEEGSIILRVGTGPQEGGEGADPVPPHDEEQYYGELSAPATGTGAEQPTPAPKQPTPSAEEPVYTRCRRSRPPNSRSS